MKIGILIRNFDTLRNYELRIIQEIIDNPQLELSLLIKDGRVGNERQTSLKSKFKRLFLSKNVLGKVLFKLQCWIERKLFFREKYTVNKEAIINKLNSIDVIKAKPKRKGFLDIFDKTDVQKIYEYKLDVILRNEFNIIRGEILTAAKYGIWSFHHADNSINRGGPPGFWEIVYKQSTVGVTLQQLTPELDGGLVIDKAFFNRHWSYVKTYDLILENSVTILLKSLKKLAAGNYTTKKSIVYYNPLYKTPNFYYSIKYIFYFYLNLAKKATERLSNKLFGVRYNCWSLFIGKGDFITSTLFRLKPAKLPKNEFWADPFIYYYDKDYYVFFENYNYKTQKGKISCGKVEGRNLVDIKDVLEMEYHLSYPYIFKEDDKIYLMPETEKNNRLEIYECIEFPNKWELYSTAFDGEKVVDAFFYNDEQKQKWLFVNKKANDNCSSDSELYIYKVDSLKMDKMEPHKNNPVIIDSRVARNGGPIFKYENKYYRPSQANIDGIYGAALNINEINKLSIEEYNEETVVTVKPNFYKGLISMHHLHQVNDLFVFDAAFKKK
jgi:hypothetical protein